MNFLKFQFPAVLLIVVTVTGKLLFPCEYNGDVKISYFNSQLIIPMDLRDQFLSETDIDQIVVNQVTPLCNQFELEVKSCTLDIIELVHKELEPVCSSSRRTDTWQLDLSSLDLSSLDEVSSKISFESADHRLPKMLPCNWSGNVDVNIHGVDVEIPVAIAVNGDVGAPVKSFAQIYSFLRPNLEEACDTLILGSPRFASSTKLGLKRDCMQKFTTAFENQIVASCPSLEKSFDIEMPHLNYIVEDNCIAIHVRSLAGDEVEHFWHIMLAELLPSVSAVLQLFDVFLAREISLDDFLANQGKVKVIIHNHLRPWGESPLHHFYDQLTAATDGVISFVGSSQDRSGHRLPRWDYECEDSDLALLKKAAMFLRQLLLPDINKVSTRKVVVQERSHNKELGSFYEQYFCDLIARGELPYLDKASCGVYGSQRRRVSGLGGVAEYISQQYRFAESLVPIEVVLTAPDSGSTLAQQIEPYIDASVMLLGHGGGMVYALFLRPNATVIEITSPTKHSERNGAARGLAILGKAIGLHVRRVVCSETSAYVVDLTEEGRASTKEEAVYGGDEAFTGDVSDPNTPCGSKVKQLIDEIVA